MKIFKVLAVSGLSVLGVYGLIRLIDGLQTKNDGEKLAVDIKTKIHKFTFADGLELWSTVTLSNPTQTSFNIQQPYFELLGAGEVYSHTTPSSTTLRLEPNGTITLETVKLKIPILSLIQFLTSIKYQLPEAIKGKPLEIINYLAAQAQASVNAMGLEVRYTTKVNDFDYSDKKTINV